METHDSDIDEPEIIDDDFDLINDDLTFRDLMVNTHDRKLQKLVIEFVTSIILKHEREFYYLIQKKLNSKFDILTTTNKSIIQMIIEINNKYYNNLYLSIQNNTQNPAKILVQEMQPHIKYDMYTLLFKLLHLTLDTHIDVCRENLSTTSLDIYEKTILTEINLYLQSVNILDAMAKQSDDDTKMPIVPHGEKPFNVVIEKNIDC